MSCRQGYQGYCERCANFGEGTKTLLINKLQNKPTFEIMQNAREAQTLHASCGFMESS
jgi:hypothetical protein